jgi:hypothetical protein
MTEKTETEWKPAEPEARREGPSLFAPIVLIALGIYLLLGNLNLLPQLNWQAALRLWPVLLIFIGLNVLVRQISGIIGTLLSGVVALAAVGFFSLVLLLGDSLPVVGSYMETELRRHEISLAEEDVSSATIDFDFSAAPVDVSALDDSPNLIEGVVPSFGDVVFDTDQDGDEVRVRVGTQGGGPFMWFNPADMFNGDERERWRIGLSPRVPLELHGDGGSGPVDLQLSELTLSGFVHDGGSGPTTVALPGGDYEVQYEGGSGPATFLLPESGQQTLEIDSGSGPVRLTLSPGTEAQLVVTDDGSGALRLSDRFELVEGELDGEGRWETPGFAESDADRVIIFLEQGSGAVTIEEEG